MQTQINASSWQSREIRQLWRENYTQLRFRWHHLVPRSDFIKCNRDEAHATVHGAHVIISRRIAHPHLYTLQRHRHYSLLRTGVTSLTLQLRESSCDVTDITAHWGHVWRHRHYSLQGAAVASPTLQLTEGRCDVTNITAYRGKMWRHRHYSLHGQLWRHRHYSLQRAAVTS